MPDACIIPLQKSLDELSIQQGYLNQPTGTLDALTSPYNGQKVNAELINKDGKDAIYRYTYLNPDCTEPTDCTETPIAICTAGTSNNIQTATATITQCLSMPALTLTMAQYRTLCDFGANQFQTQQILGRMIKLRKGINNALAADLCAALGCFNTGVTEKDLAMLGANRIPNWSADEEIMLDFEDRGVMLKPILIGGRSVRYYQNAIKKGGLNGEGVDISQMDEMVGYYDNGLQGICVPDENKETLLAITPGVFQVVNFLENVGMFQTQAEALVLGGQGSMLTSMFQDGQEFAHGVIQDPISGWMFDLDAIYDKCLKQWTINISTKFDTLRLPLLGCEDACFNGLLKYQLCEITDLTCATPVV